MKTSPKGRALIRDREGERLKAYRDSKGIPTIGVGHVNMTPPVARMGMTITRAESDAMLAADLGEIEAVINKGVKVPMSQNEFDAMASLGFNIGVGGLKRSSVIKRLNLGDVRGAADAFLMWSKPAVLVGRRKAERLQFLQPDAKVSTARLETLALKATTTNVEAKANNQAAGATIMTAAATTATAAIAAPHTFNWLLWISVGGGLLVIIAVIFAIAAARAHAKARILASNAAEQPELAPPESPAPEAGETQAPPAKPRTARTKKRAARRS